MKWKKATFFQVYVAPDAHNVGIRVRQDCVWSRLVDQTKMCLKKMSAYDHPCVVLSHKFAQHYKSLYTLGNLTQISPTLINLLKSPLPGHFSNVCPSRFSVK